MSIQSLPDEIFFHILQLGVEKDILDIPNIKNFKLVSRRFYQLGSKNCLWYVVVRKINDAISEKTIRINIDIFPAEESCAFIFGFLKNDVLQEISLAKKANLVLSTWVENEISIKNITIKKICELKEKILQESKSIEFRSLLGSNCDPVAIYVELSCGCGSELL